MRVKTVHLSTARSRKRSQHCDRFYQELELGVSFYLKHMNWDSFYAIHNDINLLRDSGAGSGGTRAPHILMCMLRALRSGLPHLKAARYDFCCYV